MSGDHHIQLDIVYRMMAAFASSSDIDDTIQQGLNFVRDAIGAEAASFFVLDPDRKTLTCSACLGPVDIKGLEIADDQGIVGSVVQTDATRFIADVANDPDFNNQVDQKTGFVTRSMICAPVSGNGQIFGAMQIINRAENDGLFSDEDAALVSVLGKSAALALANSELTHSMVEARLLKRDLSTAARVQQNLYPADKLDFVQGMNIPKKGVSGDLFDYVLRDGSLYFCMGDVSGKGIDAALVMSKTHSLFRSMSRIHQTPNALAAAINQELVETAFGGMFVTAIIGIYTPDTGHTRLCNAGHEPGLVLFEDGSTRDIGASTQPLGILDFEADEIEVEEIDLSRGRLFCFSDGLTEAEIAGEMIGRDKITDILRAQMELNIDHQVTNTVHAIQDHATELSDDLTLLGLGQAMPLHLRARNQAPDASSGSSLSAGGGAETQPDFIMTLSNEVTEIRRMRREMGAFLAGTHAAERMSDVELTLSEAVQNIIRHAFEDGRAGRIELASWLGADKLTIMLTDNAPQIDLDKVKPRELDDLREGGLGTHFIKTLAAEAEWSNTEEGNALRMVFTL